MKHWNNTALAHTLTQVSKINAATISQKIQSTSLQLVNTSWYTINSILDDKPSCIYMYPSM